MSKKNRELKEYKVIFISVQIVGRLNRCHVRLHHCRWRQEKYQYTYNIKTVQASYVYSNKHLWSSFQWLYIDSVHRLKCTGRYITYLSNPSSSHTNVCQAPSRRMQTRRIAFGAKLSPTHSGVYGRCKGSRPVVHKVYITLVQATKRVRFRKNVVKPQNLLWFQMGDELHSPE